MTRDDVIRLAREAGHPFPQADEQFLIDFAAMVAAEEREACAKAFEEEADTWKAWPQAGAAKRKGASAIRARK